MADYFAQLEESRIERTKQHKLIDLVTIAICAVICGADTWVGIEIYVMRLSKTVPSSLRTSITVLKQTRSRSPTLRDRAESLELRRRKRSDRANFFSKFLPLPPSLLVSKEFRYQATKIRQ